MAVPGTIRQWHDDEGWGVVDSAETPGGCWAHFSAAAVDGYGSFAAGQPVWLEWETPGQEGFPFRAVRLWPHGADPVTRRPDSGLGTGTGLDPAASTDPGTGAAYTSTLRLTFDPPPPG